MLDIKTVGKAHLGIKEHPTDYAGMLYLSSDGTNIVFISKSMSIGSNRTLSKKYFIRLPMILSLVWRSGGMF